MNLHGAKKYKNVNTNVLTNLNRSIIMESEAEFEWDEKKDAINLEKHGIGFEEAVQVFFDPFYSELYDKAHSGFFEDRWKAFGLIGEVPVMVSYTERNARIRIISARKATISEQEAYYGNG
jgi:uncharacterized DUF497 family protein